MRIALADTDAEILRCFPVMQQLRPHLEEPEFLGRVASQQREGYRLAFVERDGQVKAVAGFRMQEMLSRGRFLYVDDLVTDGAARSEGYGESLIEWLCEFGRAHGCSQLDLDSGSQRHEAHRFYFRERMRITAYHFSRSLTP